MSHKEIRVPVPWGVMAGKSWGDESKKMILMFHGFQDNANSFDNLIEYLPKSFHYVCMDLPSHGKSSHLDTKSLPSLYDFVLSLKFVIEHFNHQKYILMGHSFGAQVCTLFTQLFPERVEKLICLDTIYFIPLEPFELINDLRQVMKNYSKFHNFKTETAPVYYLEDAVERMKVSRVVPITDESATALLQRALQPAGNDKYKFTLAQHLKYLFRTTFSLEYTIDLIKSSPVQCPHLVIKASGSKPYYDYLRKILEVYESTNKLFEAYTVKGTHDVHIEKPKEVAKYINKFLLASKI